MQIVKSRRLRYLDTLRQAIMNFSGPAIGAALFALTLWWIRNPDLRLAVEANIAILVFYAAIETAYLLLWSTFHVDADLLVTPEFNYGIPLLIMVIAAAARGFMPGVRFAPADGD